MHAFSFRSSATGFKGVVLLLDECLKNARSANVSPRIPVNRSWRIYRMLECKSLPPFFHTGVDCFGPLFVKQGRSHMKRYDWIFSCMMTRAVHLEVLHSLSCDSFISALRRFITRRSSIGHLHSDNGTNFVGGNKVINEAIRQWNQRQVSSFLFQKEIEWHFNAPLSSHFASRLHLVPSGHLNVS